MIPKFRAWDKTHKKLGMIDAHMTDGLFQSVKIFDEDGDDWQESENFILMQSTGLKDRNGKEIFEGDIVSIDTDEFDLLFVKYEVGIYCLMDDEGCAEYLSDYYIYVSVVGNIYENKEYLKKRGN